MGLAHLRGRRTDGQNDKSAELGQTLGRLRKLGGRTPGPAIWRVDGAEIEVEWKGGAETLSGRGQGRASFRVDARYIEALAKTLKPSGALDVEVHTDGRVRFGSFTVPYVAVTEGETHLLPGGRREDVEERERVEGRRTFVARRLAREIALDADPAAAP